LCYNVFITYWNGKNIPRVTFQNGKVDTVLTLKNGDGIVWPHGKRIAALVTFDLDAELLRQSVVGRKDIGFSDTSRGQFGPLTGLPRCLAMLRRQGLKTTFFVPGRIAEEYPEAVAAIVRDGHELAYHGYDHDNTVGLPREQEEANMARSEALLTAAAGVRPVGARGPLDVLQEYSTDLFKERGYLYDSTLKDCDWPYVLPNGLVELPVDVAQDDFPFFYFTYADGFPIYCSYLPDDVRVFWQDAFDELAAEGDKVFVLKLHPQLIGRLGRLRMVEQFLLYMQQNGAWLTTCREAAEYVRDFYAGKNAAGAVAGKEAGRP
jgi:peptidoglycan-N-acetylglucosamine deacetylase